VNCEENNYVPVDGGRLVLMCDNALAASHRREIQMRRQSVWPVENVMQN